MFFLYTLEIIFGKVKDKVTLNQNLLQIHLNWHMEEIAFKTQQKDVHSM